MLQYNVLSVSFVHVHVLLSCLHICHSAVYHLALAATAITIMSSPSCATPQPGLTATPSVACPIALETLAQVTVVKATTPPSGMLNRGTPDPGGTRADNRRARVRELIQSSEQRTQLTEEFSNYQLVTALNQLRLFILTVRH